MTSDEINTLIQFLNKSGLLKNTDNNSIKKMLENLDNTTNDIITNDTITDDTITNNDATINENNLTTESNTITEDITNNTNNTINENNLTTESTTITEDITNNTDNTNNISDTENIDSLNKINELISESNKKIKEHFNKNKSQDKNDKNDSNDSIISSILNNNVSKNIVNETHDTLRNNINKMKDTLKEKCNNIIETEERINNNYKNRLDTIRNNLKSMIEEKNNDENPLKLTRTKNLSVPPLNLKVCNEDNDKNNTSNNTDEKNKCTIYDILHNKLLYRINQKNKSIYTTENPDKYTPYSSRYSSPTPLTSRYDNKQPYTSRYDRPAPSYNSRYDKPAYTSRYDRPSYSSPYDRPGSKETQPPIRSFLDNYIRPKYQEDTKLTDKYKTSSEAEFDELCKKYEIDRANDNEIIITTTVAPGENPLDIINNAINKFEKELLVEKSDKSTMRSIFEKFKNHKKASLQKYDKDELAYYESLETEKKIKIDKIENKISNINNIKTPLRFKVLQSNLPIYNKSMIINKLEDLFSNKLLGGSETTKYSNWVNSLLKVPFKKYKKLPLDSEKSSTEDIGKYLIDVKKTLDTAVYGHTKTKEQVIQIIAQWITNPNSIGNCIGIQGVMGNGKTTLVKNGIAKAIGRPFAFITLGGCSDASFLEGHNYTYEGSMWGKVVDVLIECKCMNPVFYFDELDKVSETPKGEEIINSLIHLTDSSQNNQYTDKYFNGIEFDISKSLFIFSYNDITKINPILLDRLITIKTDEFKLEDKIHIAKNYLLKEIYAQLCIEEDTYKIEEDNIKYIIETYTNNEGGVRTLKKHLYNIFSKFNLLNLTKEDSSIKYTFDLKKNVLEEKIITNDIIDIFIKDNNNKNDEYYKNWYV